MKNIIMYGADWCGDCVRAKIVFEKYNVDYEYVDVDANEAASELVIKLNNGNRSLPTIVLPDGKILVEPSEAEIVEALNLKME